MLSKKFLFGLTFIFAASFASTSAFADESSPASLPMPPPAPHKETEWYGYQTIGADVVAVGLACLSSSGKEFGTAAGLTYALGAPVIHFANGRGYVGVGDLGIRVVSPLTGALIGAFVGVLVAPRNDPWGFATLGSETAGAGYGLMIGAALASVLDATVLARKEVTRAPDKDAAPPAPAPANDAAKVRFSPTFTATATGATGGVVGTF